MGSITCLPWRSTRRAQFRRWLNNVCWVLRQTCSSNFSITADSNGMMGSMMQDLAFAIPGVDEAMSFAEIMKHVCSPLLHNSR